MKVHTKANRDFYINWDTLEVITTRAAVKRHYDNAENDIFAIVGEQ